MEPMTVQVSSEGQYPPTEQGDIVANSQLIGNMTSESSAVATPDGSIYGDAIAYVGNANPISEGDGGDPKCNSKPDVGTSASMSVVGHDYKTVESACAAPAPHGSFNVDTNAALSMDGTMGNGNTLSDPGAPASQQLGDVSGVSSEEERLWGLVRTNCLDFNAWTALIHETEKENNILKIRNVYDSFLAEFPLCYGYWKKYADHEGSLSTVEKAEEVYERAVSAVTYSVDIWVHYCQFKISTHGDPDNIRRLFERGLAYVGTDYLSAPLWDEYINYEFALQEWSNVMAIYTRILEYPIQQLDRYFNSFKEYVVSRPLAELQTSVESATLSAGTEMNEQGIEGEVHPDDTEKSSLSSVSAESKEADELEKFIAIREEMYKNTKEFDSKILQFETSITRPYFHVKPLDEPELENWHKFLDFFESGEDLNKVVKLYERCLIACANYPEFWIRYALSMEASGSMELASNALARATQVFVKKQPDIHLFAARFKEHNGDIAGARAEYQYIYSECSSVLLEAIVRHANMEYRLGNKDTAFSIYEGAISSEHSKEHTQMLPFLFVQYSRFTFLVAGNAEKAREIITNAIEKVHLSKFFIEAVIHLESLFPSPKKIDYLDSLVEKFLLPSPDDSNVASTSCREEVSCIFLEFLDLFGDSQSIKKAENRHFKSFLQQRSTSVSRKRRSEDYFESDKVKFSKTHTGDLSSSQSVMGAYPNVQQNPWSSGYGQNPPAWSQPPQAQVQQQWNSGYAPQDGYSGYGSYGSYAQPQVPASAPQTTTYGAYPTTSSVQAYPQQNYAQPTAAPSYAAPQAIAPATQAYYNNYY